MKHPLESEQHKFITGYAGAIESFTKRLVQIETYDLDDTKMTATIYGAFRKYRESFGAIHGFYVNAYDDPNGGGVDLLYSFKDLDTALDLIKKLQDQVKLYKSKNSEQCL